jgi:hypothetical protein
MGATSVMRPLDGARLVVAFLLALSFYTLLVTPGIGTPFSALKVRPLVAEGTEDVAGGPPNTHIDKSGLHSSTPVIATDLDASSNQKKPEATHELDLVDTQTLEVATELDQDSLPAETASISSRPPCFDLPGASDVLLVLKTGATEIYEKLPAHFLTTFQCTSDFLIYSDLEQDIGPYHIIDAMESVSDETKKSHQDFELYRVQAQLASEGQDVGALKGDRGWDLDKWKFLPMVIDAARKFPDKKWFVFMEADTLLSWSNLLIWLSKLDATKPLYLGCPVMIGETVFAHGGSGWVLSGPAVKKLVELEGEMKKAWEERTAKSCCGDQVLAEGLLDGGIGLTGAFPMIQGLTPTTLDWSSAHWCSPVVSWHHMSANEVDAVWQMEQAWIEEKVGRFLISISVSWATLTLNL